MKIIPCEKYSITTSISKEQFLFRLQSLIDEPDLFRPPGIEKPFEGVYNDSGFIVQRNMPVKKSSLPTIAAKFREASGGLIIEVKIVNILIYILTILSFPAIAGLLYVTGLAFLGKINVTPALLTVFTLSCFAIIVLFNLYFWAEAKKLKSNLPKLLGLETENDRRPY